MGFGGGRDRRSLREIFLDMPWGDRVLFVFVVISASLIVVGIVSWLV